MVKGWRYLMCHPYFTLFWSYEQANLTSSFLWLGCQCEHLILKCSILMLMKQHLWTTNSSWKIFQFQSAFHGLVLQSRSPYLNNFNPKGRRGKHLSIVRHKSISFSVISTSQSTGDIVQRPFRASVYGPCQSWFCVTLRVRYKKTETFLGSSTLLTTEKMIWGVIFCPFYFFIKKKTKVGGFPEVSLKAMQHASQQYNLHHC